MWSRIVNFIIDPRGLNTIAKNYSRVNYKKEITSSFGWGIIILEQQGFSFSKKKIPDISFLFFSCFKHEFLKVYIPSKVISQLCFSTFISQNQVVTCMEDISSSTLRDLGYVHRALDPSKLKPYQTSLDKKENHITYIIQTHCT